MVNGQEGIGVGPWERTVRLTQLDAFPQPRDRLLAQAGVSIEEVERWRARGWISFDVRDVPSLDEGRVAEICFIRNLARAGLTKVQVSHLLGQLERPYTYDPMRTAYSFALGWVQVPLLPTDEDRDAYVHQHLPGWVERKALLGAHDLLTEMSHQIIRAIARVRASEHRDEEAE